MVIDRLVNRRPVPVGTCYPLRQNRILCPPIRVPGERGAYPRLRMLYPPRQEPCLDPPHAEAFRTGAQTFMDSHVHDLECSAGKRRQVTDLSRHCIMPIKVSFLSTKNKGLNGTRGGARTRDLRFRKPLLCPAELPGRKRGLPANRRNSPRLLAASQAAFFSCGAQQGKSPLREKETGVSSSKILCLVYARYKQ